MSISPVKKDFFDILSNIGGVSIAIAGVVVTFLYNMNESRIQELKVNSDIKAAQIEMLDKGMKYVSSPVRGKREAGYLVIKYAGFDSLVLVLANSYKDLASKKALNSIVENSTESVKAKAKMILKDLNTEFKKNLNYLIEKGNLIKEKKISDIDLVDEYKKWIDECLNLIESLDSIYKNKYLEDIKNISMTNEIASKYHLIPVNTDKCLIILNKIKEL
jgi:hypothetical protein